MWLCLFFNIVDIDEPRSNYHYKDVIAQAYCAHKGSNSGHCMSAVRRDCDEGVAPSCSDICRNVTGLYTIEKDVFVNNIECFGALWVMMDHPVLAPNPGPGQSDAGLLNLVTISYDQCSATDCRANYCCCETTPI